MLWRYLGAWLYDLCILMALYMGFTLIMVALNHGAPIPAGTRWFQVGLVSLAYLYYVGSLCYGGQTIGFKAWGLRLCLPGASGPIAAIHRRIVWFWVAFVCLQWTEQQRLQFLRAHKAAVLEKLSAK